MNTKTTIEVQARLEKKIKNFPQKPYLVFNIAGNNQANILEGWGASEGHFLIDNHYRTSTKLLSLKETKDLLKKYEASYPKNENIIFQIKKRFNINNRLF